MKRRVDRSHRWPSHRCSIDSQSTVRHTSQYYLTSCGNENDKSNLRLTDRSVLICCQTTRLPGMDRTATLSAYIRALFVKEMGERTDNLEMPRTISLDILEECHYAIKLVVRAIKNQSRSIDYLSIICSNLLHFARTNQLVSCQLRPRPEKKWF
jgi:hypothetical protein